MRFRSTIAAAALFVTHSVSAFDASTINFEQQAYHYNTTSAYSLPALDNAQPVDTGYAFDVNEYRSQGLPRYLSTSSGKDWDYLMGQTYTILGLSVATVGLMTFLPESVTNWTPEDRDFSNLGKKWWDNVSEGPVWDKDDHYLNYVMHPYFGGVYYTAARHSGFTEFESFLYSFTMSTFFWEYGVEAFAEVPSIQDIIVTPLFGAAVGEWMYLTEQNIVADGGEVLGSDTLGGVSLFLLNPVGHIHGWVTNLWQGDTEVRMNYDPWFNNQDAARYAADAGAPYDSQFIGMQVSLKF
ncbi:DUF3943 domain-containing protein [Grimontia sp. S25]|uniref:DUF3943 domain-containing protein n=1 Tax=Grimontia sedimenti TaxID=2711294 RepID=A0A6M1R5Z4_9GAMM|nr:DUF3943 domain-containing protein [Grimontia sedimenti]